MRVRIAVLFAASCVGQAYAGWNENAVWSFTGGADGTQPRGDLIIGNDSALYGTASSGGINQSGTVFRVGWQSQPATEQTIYNFTGGVDGSLPSAALIQDNAGALYGTAARNGSGNAGTVFRLAPPAAGQTTWTETTLWGFSGGADGAQPIGSLIADRSGSGVLYGTTNFGGTNNAGVVFGLTPPAAGKTAWTEQVLWSFTGGADGAKPAAALVQGSNGTLYGTASFGGADGAGTVFALAPPASKSAAWTLTTLHTFTGAADGATPMGTLSLDPTGALFGTTEFGGGGDCAQPRYPYYPQPESQTEPAYNAAYIPIGGNSCGVVFKLMPPVSAGQPWAQSIVWSFQAGWDGGNPVADLVITSEGLIYGLTPQYGDPGPNGIDQYADKGNVFILEPAAVAGGAYTETTPISFGQDSVSTYTRAGLTAGPTGQFFTTASFGGGSWVHLINYGYGSVFSMK